MKATHQKTLDTSNPDHLTYESGMLQIAILGGIRLEGLDRMRATLKIQVEHLSLRHNSPLAGWWWRPQGPAEQTVQDGKVKWFQPIVVVVLVIRILTALCWLIYI